MTITALPEATVHLLGSAQVLTTPTSLIKELIDNALDAKATSIDILISKNTLDKLEVRDNGHGIASEDFDSLGKRGHTSKLRSFEELKFIGGVTLGFRGEALASAVELGDVSVTTKTEGEAVATKLVLKAPGGVHQKTRTSHPVGTTISVLKFMYNIPVRKQTFEKEATKTLAKINQMLRSYSLARPSIRFSLKVTGGGKGSWSFAPRPNDGIKEVVSQVISRDVAMECFEKSFTLSSQQSKDTAISGNLDVSDPISKGTYHTPAGCFAIEAFLPKPDADASKVGTGQYLSIDSRPVSHEKGTVKKIVTMFKKYIRGALTDSSEQLKNPFIRLNIKCPTASYDANVEPAKDDVLFGNEPVVLGLAESLLKEVYGDLKHAPLVSAPKLLAKKLDDFELLLARKPTPTVEKSQPPPITVSTLQRPPSSSSPTLQESSPAMKQPSTAGENLVTELEQSGDELVGSDHRKWEFNMTRDFSEDVDGRRAGRPNRKFRPNLESTADREVSGTNPLDPWIITKMTAPIIRDRATSEPNVTIEESSPGPPTSKLVGSDHIRHQNAFVPLKTKPRQTFHSDDIRVLQSAVTREYPTVTNHEPVDDGGLFVERDSALPSRRRNDFVSAGNIPASPPPHYPKGPARSRGPNRKFVSPRTTGGNRVAPADRLVQTTLFGNNPRPRRQSDGGHVMPQIEPNPDLAWAMDFEQRKEDATRRRREELHAAQMEAKFSSSSAPLRSSPHKNRYNSAVAALEVDQPRSELSEQPKEPFKTTLPDGDPRAYLMRRQKSLAAKKGGGGEQQMMRRAKSTKLPLEKVPEEQHLQNLVYNLQTKMDDLQGAVEKLAKADIYVRLGNQTAGLMMKSDETSGMARKFKEAVGLWMKTDEERRYEVEYNFDNLLKSKSLSA
jgi:DNA mismatch repair protein MutL